MRSASGGDAEHNPATKMTEAGQAILLVSLQIIGAPGVQTCFKIKGLPPGRLFCYQGYQYIVSHTFPFKDLSEPLFNTMFRSLRFWHTCGKEVVQVDQDGTGSLLNHFGYGRLAGAAAAINRTDKRTLIFFTPSADLRDDDVSCLVRCHSSSPNCPVAQPSHNQIEEGIPNGFEKATDRNIIRH